MGISKIIIAIDGYSSTGKSTFAKLIAGKLDYIYIDTGALYRAVTLYALRNGWIAGPVPGDPCPIDTAALQQGLKEAVFAFRPTGPGGKSETYLGGENIESEIRTMEISERVSYISALPFVRAFVDDLLHAFGKEKGVVMDGRDIGTAVFPDAELKIFMTASPRIRAERRYRELLAAGRPQSLEQVLKNLEERDYLDTHRQTDPLVRAEDAILLDNSNMTIQQQVEWLRGILRSRFGLEMKTDSPACS